MRINRFKTIGLMLCFAASTMIVSCNPDDKEDTNPLVGTKWATSAGGSSYYVLEFPTATQCQLYHADNNLVANSTIGNGTYKVNGSVVTFSGVEMYYFYSYYTPETGTISANTMTTKGKNHMVTSTADETYPWNETWTKR